MIPLIVLGVLVVALLFWLIGVYNRLVALRQRFKNAYAQIDVQLRRRYDLIPNLVQTAKAYMAHERQTLEAVIVARNSAQIANNSAAAEPGDFDSMKHLSSAETILTGALTRFMALAEAYPDLKANQNMMQLTEELSSTENKVAFSRQAYNDAVATYNTSRETFPNNLLANKFGFQAATYFEIEEAEVKQAPKVSFD